MEDSVREAVYNLSVFLVGALILAVFLLNKTRRNQLIQVRKINFVVAVILILVLASTWKWSLVNYNEVIGNEVLLQIATMKIVVLAVFSLESIIFLMLLIRRFFKIRTSLF